LNTRPLIQAITDELGKGYRIILSQAFQSRDDN